MQIDPRSLKPADLARLLNSTPLGTVLDERQLYRHRMQAGFRIGDGMPLDGKASFLEFQLYSVSA